MIKQFCDRCVKELDEGSEDTRISTMKLEYVKTSEEYADFEFIYCHECASELIDGIKKFNLGYKLKEV